MEKITKGFIQELIDVAKSVPRQRTNYNFHKEDKDPLQRMMNVMLSGTYIQPHKHENPNKREAFILLSGKSVCVEYDDNGNVIDHIILDPQTGNYGAEVKEKRWHSLIALETSVFYEVKDGPYEPANDKKFAPWAPIEGDKGCDEFNNNVLKVLGLK